MQAAQRTLCKACTHAQSCFVARKKLRAARLANAKAWETRVG